MSTVRTLAITSVALFATTGLTLSAAQADPASYHSCHHRVEAHGLAEGTGLFSKTRAERHAIEHWDLKVAERCGAHYARWWRAREKRIDCRIAGNETRCEVAAMPTPGWSGWYRWNSRY